MREEITFENSEGKKLVGILHFPEGKTDKIVIIAHGFTSNKGRERYSQVAGLINKCGIALLRFDFGASGESYDTDVDVDKQVDDLKSAILFVNERGYSKVGILGESLGGFIAIQSISDSVRSLVLWAPCTHSKVSSFLDRHPEKKEFFEKNGFVEKLKDGKKFVLNKKYFDDRLNVNQDELISKIDIPTLIFHGDKDDICPLEHSVMAKDKNDEIILEIIKDAKHDTGDEEEVREKTASWFKENLK